MDNEFLVKIATSLQRATDALDEVQDEIRPLMYRTVTLERNLRIKELQLAEFARVVRSAAPKECSEHTFEDCPHPEQQRWYLVRKALDELQKV